MLSLLRTGCGLNGPPDTNARHTVTVPATWNEDRIAIDVYRRAQQTGEPITLGTVERHIDELLSHPPDCPCGLCTAAASVRPWGVWYGRPQMAERRCSHPTPSRKVVGYQQFYASVNSRVDSRPAAGMCELRAQAGAALVIVMRGRYESFVPW